MKKYIWITGLMLTLSLCVWNGKKEIVQNVKEENIEKKDTTKHTSVLYADYPIYDSAGKLVEAADLVFTGKVKNITYEMLNIGTGTNSLTGLKQEVLMPYTIFEIKVSNVYKGETIENDICLKRPGGNFNSEIYELDGATDVEIGKEYLFVAETYENSYASFLNAEQASYDLTAPVELTEDNNITVSQILDIFNN